MLDSVVHVNMSDGVVLVGTHNVGVGVRMPLGLLLYISVTILVVAVAHALMGLGN